MEGKQTQSCQKPQSLKHQGDESDGSVEADSGGTEDSQVSSGDMGTPSRRRCRRQRHGGLPGQQQQRYRRRWAVSGDATAPLAVSNIAEEPRAVRCNVAARLAGSNCGPFSSNAGSGSEWQAGGLSTGSSGGQQMFSSRSTLGLLVVATTLSWNHQDRP